MATIATKEGTELYHKDSVSKIVQISAVPPGLLKTDANPEGLPSQAFDGLRAGLVGASIPVLQGPEDAVSGDELIRRTLEERDDPRELLPDPHATYYGAELNERTLLPGDDASLAKTRYEDWLGRSTAQQQRTLSVKGA